MKNIEICKIFFSFFGRQAPAIRDWIKLDDSMAAQKKSILFSSKLNNYSTERLFNSLMALDLREVTIQNLLQEGVDLEARDSKGYTPLIVACMHVVQEEIVQLLIKSGANVDCCDGEKCTVLHYASFYNYTETVRSIAKKVPDLNARDIRGDTPLHIASKRGRPDAVKCLVEEGADIDLRNQIGFSPLLCAAACSRQDVVVQLLDYGTNVDGDEGLLLYYASLNRWTGMVSDLLRKSSTLSTKYYAIGETAWEATSSREHLEVVKCLMEDGTDVNTRTTWHAAFHVATKRGHLEVLKWLVKKVPDMKIVPDINARYNFGDTALHIASLRGHLEVVKYLVEKGVDINAWNHVGMTALYLASSRTGSLEIVKYLVEKGANIHITSVWGQTALHTASTFGHLEIVKLLVKKGADIHKKMNRELTPLLFAAVWSRKDVVDQLIYYGANVNDSINQKVYLLHYASRGGWIEIVQSLVKEGCDLNARNMRGCTALFYACLGDQFGTAQYLLQKGASWDIANEKGRSPLNYLAEKDWPDFKFIKLFIENGAYLKPVDYDAIVKSSSLEVLHDVKLCCQSIINNFNYHDLPELYRFPASGILPRIEEMKIASGSEVAQRIEQTVRFEIQTKGHCNIRDVRPMSLSVFSVRTLLIDYEKKKSKASSCIFFEK